MNATTEQNPRKFGRFLYEDDNEFGDKAYRETRKNAPAVAWTILGWELVPDEDTEWTGIYQRSGSLLAIMKGDDYVHHFQDESDFEEISEEDYCGGCGQIGCCHG